MKRNLPFFTIFSLLLSLSSAYAQKEEIKDALKQLKVGNSEEVIAILSPVEYLISNASVENKVHFYYIKGTALADLASKNINTSQNLSQAVVVFNDLIETEQEANTYKYTAEANQALKKIKEDLVNGANKDLVDNNYKDCSDKFYQAYLIDKKDTLQLYNAALSFKNANDSDLALKCFEELKAINYTGNIPIYIAYNKALLKDEYFATAEERNATIQSGTHLRPRQEFKSKKIEIYKTIAIIYIQKGDKEKAIKTIAQARSFDTQDQSLALMEANLYLVTQDYNYFNNLVSVIIEKDPTNAELMTIVGLNCQHAQYFEGAEYYYKKAIEMNPQYVDAYTNLSVLLVEKSFKIAEKMENLGTSSINKKQYEELKMQKEQVLKNVLPYLQKVVSIDAFNSSVKQILDCMNTNVPIKNISRALAVIE